MSTSQRTHLMVFLLLVTVLLAPFNSFAHDVTSGAADTCACHLMPADCATEEDQPEGSPGDTGPECCDCEDHCQETAEPPVIGNLSLNLPEKQLFPSSADGRAPEVYLAIVVPPQNCSLG